MSTIFNAIGCRVEVEKMIATGRIDMEVETTNFIYVLELKLSNNGGIDAATEQIVVSWHDTIVSRHNTVISWHDTIVSRHNTVISWHDTTVSRHETEPYITPLTLVSRL